MEAPEQNIITNKSKRKKRRRVSAAELYAVLESVLPFAEDEVEFLNADLGNWPEDAEDAQRGKEAIESARRLIGMKSPYIRRKARTLPEVQEQADA